MQMIKDNFLKLFVDLFLFSEDYIALSLNGLGLKFRILQNIREYVYCSGDIRVEGLGIIDGVFALYMRISEARM